MNRVGWNFRFQVLFVLVLHGMSSLAFAGGVQWELRAAEQAKKLLPSTSSASLEQSQGVLRDLDLAVQIELDQTQVRRTYRRVLQFDDADAIERYGTLVIPFDGEAETLVFRQVTVIGTDGKTTQFDPDTAEIVDTKTYAVYTDTYEVVVPLPALEPGAIGVLEYEEIAERKLLDGPWMSVLYPKTAWPRERFSVSLDWSKASKPHWYFDEGILDCEETATKLSCTASNLSSMSTTDSYVWLDHVPQMVISESADWDSVIRYELKGIRNALADSTGVAAILDKLLEQSEEKNSLFDRIFEFVSRDIRYVSASEGKHSIEPHSPAETLSNRYGDCKDKSVLLVELLRRAGIRAWPVLVSTRRYDPARLMVPGLWWFNHMIVCGERGNGSAFCLDPTDVTTAPGTLTASVQGAVALPLLAGGRPQSLPSERYLWRAKVNSRVRFNSKGGQSESQERIYEGAYASWVRARVAGKTEKERTKWHVDDYQNKVTDITTPSVKEEGIDTLAKQVRIHTEAEFEPLFNPEEDINYSEISAWLMSLLTGFSSDNEIYPHDFEGIHFVADYTYSLPGPWQIRLPGHRLELKTRFGKVVRNIKITKQDNSSEITYSTTVELPARRIEVSQIQDFNDFLELIRNQTLMWFTAGRQ